MIIRHEEEAHKIWVEPKDYLSLGVTGADTFLTVQNLRKLLDFEEAILEVCGPKFTVDFFENGRIEVRHHSWDAAYIFENKELPKKSERQFRVQKHEP